MKIIIETEEKTVKSIAWLFKMKLIYVLSRLNNRSYICFWNEVFEILNICDFKLKEKYGFSLHRETLQSKSEYALI